MVCRPNVRFSVSARRSASGTIQMGDHMPLTQLRSRGPRISPRHATLTHACVINVSYPTPANDRGDLQVPEMKVGAATLPLLAALVHQVRPDCCVRMWDEIGTPIDFAYVDG